MEEDDPRLEKERMAAAAAAAEEDDELEKLDSSVAEATIRSSDADLDVDLPPLRISSDGELRLEAPGPNVDEVVFWPVSVRTEAIGKHEVLVWECVREDALWGFVKSSHACQMGRVQIVARCRRRSDGRVRYIKHPEYIFGALKAQSKREIANTEAKRAAGRGGDDTVLEKALLVALRPSPHIADIFTIWHDDSNVYTLLEYLRGGELTDVINKSPHCRLPEGKVRAVLAQVLLGLRAMHHGVGYAHCDLSPENVLFALPEAHAWNIWGARLIDFGAAKPLVWRNGDREVQGGYPDEEGWEEAISPGCEHPFGKSSYLSPEYYQRKPHRRRQLDLWAIGVMAYVSLAGEYLYDRPVPADPKFAAIDRGRLDIVVERLRERMAQAGHAEPTADCVDFISGLLDPDPDARPQDVDQLLQHRWIADAAERAEEAVAHLRAAS